MHPHFLWETALTLCALAILAASVLLWLSLAARVGLERGWLARDQHPNLLRMLRKAGIPPDGPLLPALPRREVPWAFFDLVALVGIWLIVSGVVGIAWRQAGWLADDAADLAGAVSQRAALAANILVPVAAMAIGLPVIALRTGATLRDLGLVPWQLGADLRRGLVAFVMLAPPVYGLQALLVGLWKPSQHPLIELFRRAPQADTFLLLCLSAGVVAPLVEELLFRVLLQGFLEKAVVFRGPVHELVFGAVAPPPAEHAALTAAEVSANHACPTQSNAARGAPDEAWSALPDGSDAVSLATLTTGLKAFNRLPPRGWRGGLPIAGSSVLFGLMHYTHGPDWIPLIVLGTGLGYLYQRTHRLLPCCVVHASLNSLSLWGLWVEMGR